MVKPTSALIIFFMESPFLERKLEQDGKLAAMKSSTSLALSERTVVRVLDVVRTRVDWNALEIPAMPTTKPIFVYIERADTMVIAMIGTGVDRDIAYVWCQTHGTVRAQNAKHRQKMVSRRSC